MTELEIEKLNCNCTVCIDCLYQLLECAMYDFTLMLPKCHGIEISEKVIKTILDEKDYKKYMVKVDEFKCKNKFYCPNNTCSTFINLDKINNSIENIKCSECSIPICLKCKKSHTGKICIETNNYKEEMELKETLALIKSMGWSFCGQCNLVIELEGGCNHMTCRHCKFEFCYMCGKEWPRNGTNCQNSCRLYSEKEEDKMLKIATLNYEEEVGRRINPDELKRLRNNIMHECLHLRRECESVIYGNLCQNCNYLLKCYSYKCKDCYNDFCQTCHHHRLKHR